MAIDSSAIGSGRTWIGFLAGALGTFACPSTIVLVLHRVDPPPNACGRRAKAAADIKGITDALQLYHDEHDRYPSSEDGLSALVPKHLGRVPADPWGGSYVYSLVDGRPYVASLGSDGEWGGEGAQADVTTDSIESIWRGCERSIPAPVGFALVLIGGLVPAILAICIPGRPNWAVGTLAGATFMVACLAMVIGIVAGDRANAHLSLLIGLLSAAAGVGVLLGARTFDWIASAGLLVLVVVLWFLAVSVAR